MMKGGAAAQFAVCALICAAAAMNAAAQFPGELSPSSMPQAWERFSVLTPAGPAEPSPEIFKKLSRLVYYQHIVAPRENGDGEISKRSSTTSMRQQATNS